MPTRPTYRVTWLIRRVYLRHMHRGVALYVCLICRHDSIICRHDLLTVWLDSFVVWTSDTCTEEWLCMYLCRHDSIICRHDSFTRVTWLIRRVYLRHMHRGVSLYVCVDVTYSYADMAQSYWLIHMRTWPTHTWDVTHSFVDMTRSLMWQNWFIDVAWLIPWRDWLIHWRDMTQLYDSIICRYAVVTHTCDMTRLFADVGYSYEWLIHMCDKTVLVWWRDSLTCVTWLAYLQTWVTYMCDMTDSCVDVTHSYVWHNFTRVMTWLNLRINESLPAFEWVTTVYNWVV